MITTDTPIGKRLLSLDLFRGATMFLLLGESAEVYHALHEAAGETGFFHAVMVQFDHHPWNGLRFWDLIQPFFMFIVGVAMPFSLNKRLEKGEPWAQVFRHILYRCGMLLLFGTGLHCVYSGKLVWELWNVLTQLSFTVLVTFLVIRLSWRMQLSLSLGLLLLAEILYRAYDPASPFVKDANFGSWSDLLLMGKINDGGGWVTVNCLSTAAHTIWGAMAGNLLLSTKPEIEKIKTLVIFGGIGLFLGYSLDWLSITPIIKRIATTSFVFASGGWALLTLAGMFWLVDVKGYQKSVFFFAVVGMNSIFIYLFANIGGGWLNGLVHIFNDGVFGGIGFSPRFYHITNALLVWGVYWYLTYFLHKHKIYFRI
ncbi:MAG: DUF5009 domain-containing protein [Bacteroidia bacterium]|nr:DUF5009 domain-containing protein [Bacteroidia bacterium]